MGIIFETLSSMTGGLIADSTTLVIGILVVGFMVMGFDMLKENLDLSLMGKRADSFGMQAEYWERESRNATSRIQKDEAELFYRHALRESVNYRLKSKRLK